jgi:hypothetical protein
MLLAGLKKINVKNDIRYCYCVLKRTKNVTQIIDLIMSNKTVSLIKKNDNKWIEFKKIWS